MQVHIYYIEGIEWKTRSIQYDFSNKTVITIANSRNKQNQTHVHLPGRHNRPKPDLFKKIGTMNVEYVLVTQIAQKLGF